jgi:hypothetical protein
LLHYIILQALDKADKLYIGCTVHSAAVITIAGKLSRPTYYPIPIDNGWLRFSSLRFGTPETKDFKTQVISWEAFAIIIRARCEGQW